MDDVGGVAGKRDALGDKRAGHKKAERMHAPRADDLKIAEMELKAPLELVMEGIVRQGHDARGLRLRLGPYNRGTPARERQDRERAGRQKMLFGAALVIALMRDIDDDGRLIVVPAVGGDAGAA